MQNRLDDLVRLYGLLDRLERRSEGRRLLSACHGRMDWPERGVYFFMEDGERRSDTGSGLRIVRVGTHALKAGSRTTLWKRLSQYKGQGKSGGNHRGSIFRLLVGASLLKQGHPPCPTWGDGSSARAAMREGEMALECRVSTVIGAMPFLWLPVNDSAGPYSMRGYIERNSIALLSNLGEEPLDPASPAWLGRLCDRGKARVRDSGLWNQNHVDEAYDARFLDTLEGLVNQAGNPS
jgi:hypothetical protein